MENLQTEICENIINDISVHPKGVEKGFYKRFLNFNGKSTLKKYMFIFCILIVVVLIIEIFVCNYKYFDSMFSNELSKIEDIKIISGLEKISDGKYKNKENNAIIEISDINMPIKYLGLNIVSENEKPVEYAISATDEANKKFLTAPKRKVTNSIQRSHFIRLHFSGDVGKLQIKFSADKDKIVSIDQLTINTKVPMMFSIGRSLFLFLLLMLLYFLRPKSFIYRHNLDFKILWQRIVIILTIISILATFYQLAKIDPFALRKNAEQEQFYLLTKSLLNGDVSIGEETNEKFLALDNPYDPGIRGTLGRHDNAYYNGKYYVYFGVAPILMYYVPYYFFTHKDLPHNMAVYFSSILSVIGIFFLLYQIKKRWFKNLSFGLYYIISLIFIFGCGIIYIIKCGDIYPLPIITGMMLAIFALGFWICAKKKVVAEDGTITENFSSLYLMLGSIFMASVVASRPQIFLSFIIGIILFWDDVFKKRTLFSKRSFNQTLALCIPFVIIGALIMWYNAARFGSVFDFGANYNLTSNDMTKRGFVFGRIGTGLFAYLFHTPQIIVKFPFLNLISIDTVYQGLTIDGKFFGGIMATEPILWLGVFAAIYGKKNNLFSDKKLWYIVMSCFVISLIIIILDTQMAGIIRRYFADFLWLMYLGSAISCFAVYDKLANVKQKYIFLKGLNVCLVICIVFHGLEIFLDAGGWGIINTNVLLYEKMQYLIAFWL